MTKKIRLDNYNKTQKKQLQKLEKLDARNLKNEEIVESLKSKFKDEISQIIYRFVQKLESLIGKDININNSNYYLFNNIYEINHDYRGNKKQSIFISEKEQKIKFKQNDSYFKQDIYYYDDTSNQVSVYYSAIEKFLIGYKENSKDYVRVANTDCYLKIHHSITNQLKMFGFNFTNYKLNPKLKDIDEYVNNILRIRLQNLKNSFSIIQQIIYQTKNSYSGSSLNPISKYYQSKIKSINTYDPDGERIFGDWMVISNNLNYDSIKHLAQALRANSTLKYFNASFTCFIFL